MSVSGVFERTARTASVCAARTNSTANGLTELKRVQAGAARNAASSEGIVQITIYTPALTFTANRCGNWSRGEKAKMFSKLMNRFVPYAALPRRYKSEQMVRRFFEK